jgi:hypothetical protein
VAAAIAAVQKTATRAENHDVNNRAVYSLFKGTYVTNPNPT